MAGSGVGSITGLYTSSGRSEWVFSADNFNYVYCLTAQENGHHSKKPRFVYCIYFLLKANEEAFQ